MISRPARWGIGPQLGIMCENLLPSLDCARDRSASSAFRSMDARHAHRAYLTSEPAPRRRNRYGRTNRYSPVHSSSASGSNGE